mmetsp:Transcript_22326/g.38183  ORF Transcript_22326/g.38183 Transcript_22326/m.38183 type:complete len:191 (+) Transcript_22326:55-627(+)
MAEPFFQWAGENGLTIDNLKVRKTIKLLLVQFTGTAAYNLNSKLVTYKLNCKDLILNGKITLDPAQRSVQYRKRFSLPYVGNRLGNIVASGKWSFSEVTQCWEPSLRVGFEFRSGPRAEAVALNSLRLKPRLYLGPLGVEARTQLTVQLPSKLLMDVVAGRGGGAEGVRDEGDTFGINLEVQQLDLVLRL